MLALHGLFMFVLLTCEQSKTWKQLPFSYNSGLENDTTVFLVQLSYETYDAQYTGTCNYIARVFVVSKCS